MFIIFMLFIISVGLAKKFIQVFVRCYRKTEMNFLANPILFVNLDFSLVSISFCLKDLFYWFL